MKSKLMALLLFLVFAGSVFAADLPKSACSPESSKKVKKIHVKAVKKAKTVKKAETTK